MPRCTPHLSVEVPGSIKNLFFFRRKQRRRVGGAGGARWCRVIKDKYSCLITVIYGRNVENGSIAKMGRGRNKVAVFGDDVSSSRRLTTAIIASGRSNFVVHQLLDGSQLEIHHNDANKLSLWTPEKERGIKAGRMEVEVAV
jgi:hypothetical protein